MKNRIFTMKLVALATTIMLLGSTITSCESGKKKTDMIDDGSNQVEVEVEVTGANTDADTALTSYTCNTLNDPAPYLRLGQLINTASGYDIIPVAPESISPGNVHVITHGFAPYYKKAVTDYKAAHPNDFLRAWYPEARETVNGQPTGERFFVGKFVPLGQSILAINPNATILCYSWIDHSATDSFDNPGKSEACTVPMGDALHNAMNTVLFTGGSYQLHFLGHSHGTKVVSQAGIRMKEQNDTQTIQLTLFDSPEDAVAGNNDLFKLLPNFEANRTNRFVDSYISYWGECYSGNASLEPIVNVVLRPSYHGCWVSGIEDCVSCAHEYGITWYTAQTNANTGMGLGWSPLYNPRATASLSRYYLQDKVSTTVVVTTDCQDGVIYSCEDLFSAENTREKPE